MLRQVFRLEVQPKAGLRPPVILNVVGETEARSMTFELQEAGYKVHQYPGGVLVDGPGDSAEAIKLIRSKLGGTSGA